MLPGGYARAMATPYLEIRADHDARTIVVYQAFRPEIVDPAVAAQRFVPPFSLGRMTWIKPSFLWMMERSGWATKAGQERIVAVRITRAGWEEALAAARLSSQDTSEAAVVVQWDPERDVRGMKLQHRAIQVGLGRQIVTRYVDEWTTEIRDVTPLVAKLRRLREDREWDRVAKLLPPERTYLMPPALRRRLGMPDAP
jgi:Domain of unknown function (DUF4291)